MPDKDKDIGERTLESYADVFADIVNAVIFEGRDVVREDDLESALPDSWYKMSGEVRTQERDVAKFWNRGSAAIRLAMFGFENQSEVDATMPMRVISYDGAAYRQQMADGEAEYFPVVTIVLYFGFKRRWKRPRKLSECVKIPEELRGMFKDYEINVVELAFLTDEQIAMFRSDFKLVVHVLNEMRKDPKYDPSEDDELRSALKHYKEMFQLMSAFTGDNSLEVAYDEYIKEKGEPTMVMEVYEKMMAKGEARGEARGFARGEASGEARGIINTARKYGASENSIVGDLVDALHISRSEAEQMLRETRADR